MGIRLTTHADAQQLTLDSRSPWLSSVRGVESIVRSIRSRELRVNVPDNDLFEGTLRGYQHDGVSMAIFTPRLLLGDQTGLGKTVQSLRYLLLLKERGEIGPHRPALVVTIPNAVYGTWHSDGFEAFVPNGLSVQVMTGDSPPRQRHRRWSWGGTGAGPDVYLLNYNILMKDRSYINALPGGVGAVVLDEGSTFKSHTVKTAEVVKEICYGAPRILILTATAIQNQLLDIHSILEALGLRWAIGSPKAFKDRHYNTYMSRKRIRGRWLTVVHQDKTQPYKNLGELRAKIWPWLYRRTYLELPPGEMPELSSRVEWVDMHPEQRSAYDLLRRKELPATAEGSGRRFVLQQRVAYMKEIATALQTFDPEADDVSAKLDFVLGQLTTTWRDGGLNTVTGAAENWPTKIVAYATRKETLMTFSRRLDAAGIGWVMFAGKGDLPGGRPFPYGTATNEREPLRRRFFEDPSVQVAMGTSAMEMAVNLHAAPVVVNLDIPMNPARVEQIAGRAWRASSFYSFVHVISLLTPRSVEEGMLRILTQRASAADEVYGETSQLFAGFTNADLEELVSRW